MQGAGLEKDLLQCREAAEHAMRTTELRVRALRDVLVEYRQAVEEIGLGVVESKSKTVRETARGFTGELEKVKEILLRLTDEADKDLDSTLKGLQKSRGLVTIALFGQTRAGKSTTLEALTGGDGTTIGIGRQHTTTQIKQYFWPPKQKTLRIVDTPGIEGFKGEELAAQAHDFVELADHIFFLISDDKVRAGELEHFAKIRSMGKGITVLLNIKRNDEDLIEDLQDPDFLFDDLLDDLFDEYKIAGHIQRIEEYLERNHDISKPTVLPIHARAAWLATQPKHKNNVECLRELSQIVPVEQRIREFIETEALGARIESPSQALRSHVVSVKAELRIFAGQFRGRMSQTDEQRKVLEKAVRNAAQKARGRLSEMKMSFQKADEQIPISVDGLIVDRGGGKKLRSEWEKILKSNGVDDTPQKFVEDARRLFAEELKEQVRRLEFNAKFEPNLDGVQSEFKKIDDYRENDKYRRIGRAGIKTAGGLAGGALTTWAIGNFWNPTGWVAGAAAAVVFGAGVLAAGRASSEIADEWRKANQKDLRKHRDDIVYNLKKGLSEQYQKTNNACSDWLNRYEETLLRDIQEPLRQVSYAQKQLWRTAVDSLEKLDNLLDGLELDVVTKLAELAVPEIKEGNIELIRAVRWEGHCTKLLVAPVRPMDNVLGRCIGRGGERIKKLRDLLSGDHVAWVESKVDFRTQIEQALHPAHIDILNVEIIKADKPINVTVSPDQIELAVGRHGSNVKMAERLLQVDKINIKQLGKK